ncbi:hypothetical protein IBX35_01075 [Candidatus Bathyarchaeota archaeon]|nr:hypothetical protein [Candidatus Bathyarchaeota archaeon]
MSENDGKLIVEIDGKNLPMHPFVQRIIRKTVLAMLSTLKGVKIQGNENIEIKVMGAT